MSEPTDGLWRSGDAYERYVGRWSRAVAREFIAWLDVQSGARWIDVGCGTGALTATVLARGNPARVVGIDPSGGFISAARDAIDDGRAGFIVGDALALPLRERSADALVSALALNFVSDPPVAVREFARVARSGGLCAAYVWDYAGGMQMMRRFWDVAVELNPAAARLDEASKFTICSPEPLTALFESAGLRAVEVRPIDVPTVFADFDDYWEPFLAGGAPAPAYAVSLDEERRTTLRERLRERLPLENDGSIRLIARAWAVRGTAP